MGGQVGILPLVTIPTPGTGKGGVAHLGTGGIDDNCLIVVAQGIFDHSAALLAELGLGAGGRSAGHMARRRVALQTGSPATDAGVLGHTFAGAAGADNLRPFIPGVAQGGGVVGDEA